MVDTFRPLHPTKAALELDDPNYPKSWEGEHFPNAARNAGANGTTNGANAHAAPGTGVKHGPDGAPLVGGRMGAKTPGAADVSG
jgi:hypothetical protein